MWTSMAMVENGLYPEYSYSVTPIILGATGLITNSLLPNLKEIGFDDQECQKIARKLQQKALLGSMKVIKSAMNLRK